MKKHFLILTLLIALVSLLLVALSLKLHYVPLQGATQAGTIDSIIFQLFSIASVVMAVCLVTLFYSIAVFRQKPGDMEDGPSWHGNAMAETLWTLVPLAIVIYLSVYGAIELHKISSPHGVTKEMEISVVAQQFYFRFEYPEQKIKTSELGLLVEQPVLFRISSKDVIHSVWVPEFRVKQDAVPGMETVLRVTPVRTGLYRMMCAELCGVAHSFMAAPVKVMTQEEFNKWVEQQRSR